MLTSANGWPVLGGRTEGSLPRLRAWRFPGTARTLLLRDGSAGFLLMHYAVWFDDELELLHSQSLDDWGYASRPIRGSTVISNHASGTAMDLNASKHPMGRPTLETFSRTQVKRVHNRLSFYKGCIRWGGDYQRRPDAMHYEIDKNLATVERSARSLLVTRRARLILEANPHAEAIILL